jgi:hypothetical protein
MNRREKSFCRGIFPNISAAVHVAPLMTKILSLGLIGALALSSVSCMTTYDAYGRPQQTVDPVVATAGVAAAGLIGYAAGQSNARTPHYHHHYHSPRYYRVPAPHRHYY